MTGGLRWFISCFELKRAFLGAKSASSRINTGASSYKLNSILNSYDASQTMLLVVLALFVIAAVLQLVLQLPVLAA